MLTCKCKNCCENVLKVSSVTTTTSLTLNVDSTITPKNGCKYILVIPCGLLPKTAVTTISQVVVSINKVNIPLQEIVGNYVFTDQLRFFNVNNYGNIVLRIIYGSTPAHFKILNYKLPCSNAYGTNVTSTKNKINEN